MSLTILYPIDETEVSQAFLAHGFYEYPDDVVAVLVRLLPKAALAIGELRAMPAGQWGVVFRNVEPGNYNLIVSDPKRLMAQHLRVRVVRVAKAIVVRLSITEPASGSQVSSTGFHAFGTAVNGVNIAGQMFANNGAGGKIADGAVVVRPAAPDWYWELSFDPLPAQANCRFSAQSGAASKNNDSIDIVDPSLLLKAKKKKPANAKKKSSKK